MVTWDPSHHLSTCSENCAVRHCSCGVPAVVGRWTCGRTLACNDARHEAKLRRFTIIRRFSSRGGRK